MTILFYPSELTSTSTLEPRSTLESESALLIDCVLRGDWAEQIILPQLGTTVNVLTADLTGQDHLHHHPRPDRTESQPQPRCTAVYDRGLTIRWDTVTELESEYPSRKLNFRPTAIDR